MASVIRKMPLLVLIGRSNTGKSSLCRLLAPWEKKRIKVGKTPGVTQQVRPIAMDGYQIIDLPGFGYMQHSSKKETEATMDLIINYIETNHEYIFLAIEVVNLPDFRRVFNKHIETSVPFDLELLHFLREFNVPTIIAANKADKLTRKELKDEISFLGKALQAKESNIEVFPLSTKTKKGFNEILELIERHLASFT